MDEGALFHKVFSVTYEHWNWYGSHMYLVHMFTSDCEFKKYWAFQKIHLLNIIPIKCWIPHVTSALAGHEENGTKHYGSVIVRLPSNILVNINIVVLECYFFRFESDLVIIWKLSTVTCLYNADDYIMVGTG